MSTPAPAESIVTKRMKTKAQGLRRVTRVALVGPDGVGKSTVIALLGEWFQQEFPGGSFHVRQWRPGWLPDLGRFIGKPPATTKAVVPRRQPGKLHLVRVFYYYWDFLLGAWWKDRVQTRPGALVIYDRCALDMQVDPVRFGLKSALGTGFVARYTPRPDLVICLEDSPERIWRRKQDIQQHEMREQLERWHKLAERGTVHAIVRVNGGPEKVAASVWQLVLGAVQEPRAQSHESTVGTGLDSLTALLGASEPGDTEFLTLPSPSHPRFLVPLASRRAAANSLKVYNPQTFMGRAWRQSVSIGMRLGVVQRCYEQRVHFHTQKLEAHLAKVTGCRDAVVSVSLGTPGVHRKPVFQVMDRAGRILAFAKAGWNDATNELVQREAAALASLAHHTFSTATVPPLLGARWHKNNFMLVMRAAEGASHGSSGALDHRHLRFLVELHALKGSPTPGSADPFDVVAGRMGRVNESGYHYYGQVLQAAIDRYSQRAGMPVGFAHGDFAPWNIRSTAGKLLVLDWEYYVEQAPAAHDLFHFLIGSGIELNRLSGSQMYRRLVEPTAERRHVESYLDGTGISREWMRPLLAAYLAETLSANILRFGNRPSSMDHAARQAWASMLGLVVRSERAEW